MVPWQRRRHRRRDRPASRPSPNRPSPNRRSPKRPSQGRPSPEAGRKRTDIAFLVAQLGAYAAERFGERAAALDFTRPQAGLLRLISREPGQSQQAVARRLGTPPSRLVALVDGLEQRGLIERRRNPGDRRNYALHPTAAGEQAMADPEPGQPGTRAGHQRPAHRGRTRPAEQAPGQAGRRARPGARDPPGLPQPVREGVPVTTPCQRARISRPVSLAGVSWPGPDGPGGRAAACRR